MGKRARQTPKQRRRQWHDRWHKTKQPGKAYRPRADADTAGQPEAGKDEQAGA